MRPKDVTPESEARWQAWPGKGRVGGAGDLIARLHEESDRQVPFSQTRLLLRQAAAEIERLKAEVARMKAEAGGERAPRQVP